MCNRNNEYLTQIMEGKGEENQKKTETDVYYEQYTMYQNVRKQRKWNYLENFNETNSLIMFTNLTIILNSNAEYICQRMLTWLVKYMLLKSIRKNRNCSSDTDCFITSNK